MLRAQISSCVTSVRLLMAGRSSIKQVKCACSNTVSELNFGLKIFHPETTFRTTVTGAALFNRGYASFSVLF